MDTSSLTPLTDALVTAVVASSKQSGAPQIAQVAATGGGAQTRTIGVTSRAPAITGLQTWFQQRHAAVAEQALDALVHHPDDRACQQQFVAAIVSLATADPTTVTALQGWAERITRPQSTDGWCVDNAGTQPCL